MTPCGSLPVYLLAGGQSSRFGSDKARARFHDRTLLEHVASLVTHVASRLTVVADRAGKYDDLGLRTIADTRPGQGPLAGLIAALGDLAAEERWLLLCPCDAVIVWPRWLTTLLDHAKHAPPDVQAIAFQGDRWQPMPALYASGIAGLARRQFQGPQRGLHHLLTQARTLSLPLPDDWPELWQANRPQELARLHASYDSLPHSQEPPAPAGQG